MASYRNLVAENAMLKATLEECLEYFEDRYDVVDGPHGQPQANKEMQLGEMIKATLGI